MRTTRTLALVLALAVAAATAVAAAGGTESASRTSWARISGPTQPGVQLGLARTGDGVLHVIWNRGATPTTILETRISPGGAVAGTSIVASGFDGNGGLAVLTMPDGTLRLFATGGARQNSTQYGVNTFTAPASGGSWALLPLSWGGTVAGASGAIGAALTKQGQPATAWRGFAALGVPPASVPQNAYQGGMTESQLATDAGSGGIVLSGVTNAGQGGVYVQQVLPTAGARTILPLPNGQNDWNTSLSGRIGAPGAYVAFADGKAIRLYQYGAGTRTLANGPFSSAAACAGPGGRLWVAWGARATGLFATRSNLAATAFEPVQKLGVPPGGSDGLTFLQCEGAAGPVDLFANVSFGSQGFFHTHLLPRFSLRARVKKTKVTITALAAGDPVGGVSVRIGRKLLTTNGSGVATATFRKGSYSARGTAAGSAPASIRFSVR